MNRAQNAIEGLRAEDSHAPVQGNHGEECLICVAIQELETSLSREKVLRDALVAIQVWDIATLQMQAMSETDKADMEPQGDYEHDARYAYPLQEKAVRTIARAALASTETKE